jgi:CHAT domain-containing protein
MPIQIQSPGWKVKRVAASRVRARRRGAAPKATPDLPGLPPEFLTAGSSVTEEAVLEPAATRTRAAAASAVDLSCDVEPGHTAILAIRHQSGALTFHPPVQSVSRTARGPSQIQFKVQLNQPATRGLVGNAIKAIVIKVAKMGADKGVSVLLPRLAEAVEKAAWKRRGLAEGWHRVSQETLAAGTLEPGVPVSPGRSLLLLHGTFSDAAGAFCGLVKTNFFDRVKSTYGDRIFAFNHFSVSRTPEQNARMLLEGLPEQATVFDVVTHSRGGLVLRTLIESAEQLGELGRRFTPGRIVLVASPNDGTPLATPKRLDDTLGLLANLLEMFPDNPFTTGTSFVANGLVWLANHVTGDLPGLRAMDGDGELIATIQGAPAPPARRYSALVSNYHPSGAVLHRLLDAGIDQFFGTANDLVVPTEGGWRIDRPPTGLIPASQIGCFGPAGNLGPDAVTHLHFFTHAVTADFLVNALLGRPHALNGVDPRKNLPDRRFLRGATDAPAASIAQAVASEESALESGAIVEPDEPPLRITVTNGDLTFESEPLLVGHYHALQLTGTEKVMDRLIGGAMTESLEMGVYPVAPGSHQIFINSRPNLERGSFMPRPAAVIVVGLGEEGKLRPTDLAQSVRQAVIAWAQRIAESHKNPPREIELAATLLGSGGAGISPADAARLVAQGVYDANALLRKNADGGHRSQRVSRLQFVELYLDRATEAWRALRMQEAATPGRYLIDDVVTTGTGPLDRPPDSGYRGTAFDFISVEAKNDTDGTPMVSYTLDTKRARSEVRGQRAQSKLVEELVATASNDQNRDEQIGRTLFNLLVPVELEPYLVGSGEIQIELDPQTAKIPWELLTSNGESPDELPWAIRVKLIRKLRIREFRQRVSDAGADASVLVIGEPACPVEYSRLPGARSEAIAVRTCLAGDAGLEVADLISDDPSKPGATAREVVNKLFERPWRIMHIAGHGVPGANGAPGGVVLSNGTFLGPEEFRNMRTVPELVFVNCCHLGAADAAQLLNTRYDRAEFASGVAGALIAIGVRCVVAAGWAVDDDAAIVFAEEFYQSLLRGNRFIVAVGEARAAARARSPHLNTWAAYQCYGDADWVLTARPADPNQAQAPRIEDFTGIGSASALRLALTRIIVRTKFQGVDGAEQLRNLEQLEKLFAGRWGGLGDVAELFAEALVEAGDLEAGMAWYERAVLAPDATASIKAAEQLANVRGRVAWEIVDTAARDLDARKEGERAGGLTPKARAAARRARLEAERSLKRAITRADDLIKRSLDLLARMVAVESTMERASLIGSAYKRQALVDAAAGRRAGVHKALRQMQNAYREAQTLGEKRAAADLYYPVSNRLTAEVALHAEAGQWRRFDRETAASLRRALKTKSETDPDFWSVVGEAELDQYEALAARKLARARPQLVRAYEDLHKRVAASRMWATVYDTACLVLPNYASHASAPEREAANEILARLRSFAHPDEAS